MKRVLLVEDKIDLREFLVDHLEMEGFRVDQAEDFKTAMLKIDRGTYDVYVLDLKLPDGNSIKLFDRFGEKLSSRTIIMTANATIPGVVDAIKKGAFNYLEKPFGPELLMAQVRKILELNQVKEENRSIKNEITSDFTLDRIIFKSQVMESVISRARVLAKTGNNILIQGETGCGKEVLARSIYNESPRKNEIFLPVNCAAIPSELFESELFGFEKGAFTGAVDNYAGRFAQADKGTLFLDEIGELPMHIQSKLLRILDENVIYRLKSQKPLEIDVRLLAATNRDLEEEAKMERFRSDLYYRLKESSIIIPPLRERPEDILPLIFYYINIYNHIYNKNVTKLSREVERFFLNYPWNGNVRELKNTVKSIIPFKKSDTIELDDLSHSVLEGKKIEKKQFVTLEENEKQYVYKALKATGYNITRSAEMLGISRPRLYRKIESLQLDTLVEVEEEN